MIMSMCLASSDKRSTDRGMNVDLTIPVNPSTGSLRSSTAPKEARGNEFQYLVQQSGDTKKDTKDDADINSNAEANDTTNRRPTRKAAQEAVHLIRATRSLERLCAPYRDLYCSFNDRKNR